VSTKTTLTLTVDALNVRFAAISVLYMVPFSYSIDVHVSIKIYSHV